MSETNMNPIFSLKNFRSFGEDGADFELAPITVLTGCNSAGKSSLVKAQLLMRQVLQRLPVNGKKTFPCMPISIDDNICIHISDKELALGNYHKVLNKTAKNGMITLAYSIHSNYLAEEVLVSFAFVELADDVVGDGLLKSIHIEKKDGTIVFSAQNIQDRKEENTIGDCESILENYRRYLLFNLLVSRYKKMSTSLTDSEYNTAKDSFRDVVHLCEKDGLLKIEGKKILLQTDAKNYNIMPLFNKDEKLPFDETIKLWLDTGSFYSYLPIFKEVEGKKKKAVRDYLLQKLDKGQYNNHDKIKDWIQYFCDDFEASNYSTFKDFFIAQESEYRKTSIWRPTTSYSIDRVYEDVLTLDEDDNSTSTPCNNRLSREEYENGWSFMSIVEALETICFDGEKLVYLSPSTYNSPSPQDSDCLRQCLMEYFHMVVYECFSPMFLDNIKYVNSSSVAIKRMYSIDDADKIGKCLRTFLNGNQQQFSSWKDPKEVDEYIPGTFINKWIKQFGIGDGIKIKGTDEGLGVLVYLLREGSEILLADEGYGITQLVALFLQIENNILTAKRKKEGVSGFLTSQFKYEHSVICVEEPEIHLHPKYQSLLADMFVEAYQKYNIHFIIETHSEYLIRKLQVMVADKENQLSPNDVSINYIDKDDTGTSHNRQIKILDDGSLDGKFGTGFFDQAASLAVTLFKSKNVLS